MVGPTSIDDDPCGSGRIIGSGSPVGAPASAVAGSRQSIARNPGSVSLLILSNRTEPNRIESKKDGQMNHWLTGLLAFGCTLACACTAGNGEEQENATAMQQSALSGGVWTTAPLLNEPRNTHAATLLASGKVLVSGGVGPNTGLLSTAELFDATTASWSPAAPMLQFHQWHTATLLQNGRLLVAAGNMQPGAELYDPATNTWSATGPLIGSRYFHAAVRLRNGKVLILGGYNYTVYPPGPLASAEIYDPTSNSWSLAAPMLEPRDVPRAALLADGRVLVAGGFGVAQPLASAEIYDPGSNTWSAAAPLNQARVYHSLSTLADGRVLCAAGLNGGFLNSVELYAPASNTWSAVAPMLQPRALHSATVLADGSVLAVGGNDTTLSILAERYDPAANVWRPTSPMNSRIDLNTAVRLDDGRVLAIGAYDIELYSPPVAAPLGLPCAVASDCRSGFCADGVCCNSECNAGTCDACSIAAGAKHDGMCKALNGNACDDGDACTSNDVCRAGQCVGRRR